MDEHLKSLMQEDDVTNTDEGLVFNPYNNENIEIIFRNPSFFLGLKFLKEISLSAFVNKVLIFQFCYNFIKT